MSELRAFLSHRRPAWLGPLAAVIAVYAVFAVLTPDTFLRTQNILTMGRQTVVVAICALGMTMVIITGGIDLSAGSLVALTTVVIARLLEGGHGPVVAVLGALAVAALVGASIGTLVGRFKMMPFVVTLGAMSILRGAAKGLAEEQKIDCDTKGLEKLLSADVSAPGLWIALALGVAVALLLGYIEHRTGCGPSIAAEFRAARGAPTITALATGATLFGALAWLWPVA